MKLLTTLFMIAAPLCSGSQMSSTITVSALSSRRPIGISSKKRQKEAGEDLKRTPEKMNLLDSAKSKNRMEGCLYRTFYRYMSDGLGEVLSCSTKLLCRPHGKLTVCMESTSLQGDVTA